MHLHILKNFSDNLLHWHTHTHAHTHTLEYDEATLPPRVSLPDSVQESARCTKMRTISVSSSATFTRSRGVGSTRREGLHRSHT